VHGFEHSARASPPFHQFHSNGLTGTPGLDFAEIFRLHRQLPKNVPVIIQDTEPNEVAAVRDLLQAAAAGAER
jgi:hypothetical protein